MGGERMDNRQLLLILALAAIITVVGVGSFLLNTTPDQLYDYTLAPIQYAPGQPINITVTLREKAGNPVTNCPTDYAKIKDYCSRYWCPGDNWCRLTTFFNARSIRISLDGQDFVNTQFYPAPSSINYSLSSSFGQVGAVCCWGVNQPCSVCSDQERAGTTSDRAFIYQRVRSPGEAGSGENVFTLSFNPGYLSNGTHYVDVYFYSETPDNRNRPDFSPQALSKLSGWTYGDKNQQINTHLSGAFYVNKSGVPAMPIELSCPEGTVFNSDSKTCVYAPPTETVCTVGIYNATLNKCIVNPAMANICTEGAYNAATNKCEVALGTGQTSNNALIILMFVAAAIIGWKVILKK